MEIVRELGISIVGGAQQLTDLIDVGWREVGSGKARRCCVGGGIRANPATQHGLTERSSNNGVSLANGG
jgi:hypothetical protein